MLGFEPITLILLGIAVAALVYALAVYPRQKLPYFRIDKVVFSDGIVSFYPMKRGAFGKFHNLEIERGIRSYQTESEAKSAMSDYLSNKLGMEISRTETVEEYGA